MNYKNYFSLNKKLIFLLGGNGLIGNEIKNGFKIKVYSNLEVGERLKNKYLNYEFLQF